jgi:general secretion pathway protein M
MSAGMTPMQSRGLAASLLVLLFVGAVALFIAPILILHHRYDNAIAQQQNLLERYQRMIAQKPQIEATLEAVKRHNGRRFFLKNTATNLAGAELQELVRAGIESSGGRVTTSQNIAPKESGDYHQITVNVQFSATTESLQKALQSLESRTPYLIIESLTLRPVNVNRTFKPAPGREPEVNAQVEVTGWTYRNSENGGAS